MQTVDFPTPSGLSVNMMPFVLGDDTTLPPELRPYASMIHACNAPFPGQVCFLTVTESYVEANTTQRRGGPHTEASNLGAWGGGPWGKGGVWMASTVNGSCRVWDEEIPVQNLGRGGCLAHYNLKSHSRLMGANELLRITDRTPHEALPPKEPGYRQFFRLVGPEVHGWYAEHSTPNPLCPLPGDIPVYGFNKFDAWGSEASAPA